MNDQHDNAATDKEMLAKATTAKEMVVFLISGDFQVHRKGCKAIYRVRKSGKAGNEFSVPAYANRYDAVADLWQDIINENVPEQHPTRHEAILSYFDNTEFHAGCLAELPMGIPVEEAVSKTDTPKPSAKQAAKRELATLVVEAAAKAALEAANAGISGIDDEDIMKIVSHWLHHLPADRERWVAAGLPKPNRSDWR